MNLNYRHLKKFKKNGYLIYENLINPKFCEKVNKIIYGFTKMDKASSELDLNFPFSKMDRNKKVVFFDKIPNHYLMNKFINFNKILKIGEFLTQKKLKLWEKIFYPKHAFDSDNEVYHQDFFYHRYKSKKNEDYIQCFIAFHDHNLSGGCLRIFSGSHKLGLVKHENIMTRNGLSKYTIPAKKLTKISKKCKLINLELKKGSCVFFNYNIIHGSSSNASNTDQNRMICQMMSVKSEHNKLKIEAVNRQRTQEEIKILQKMIATLKKHNKKLTAG